MLEVFVPGLWSLTSGNAVPAMQSIVPVKLRPFFQNHEIHQKTPQGEKKHPNEDAGVYSIYIYIYML